MLLKAGSMFSVNRIRTSLGDAGTVQPTLGSASLRKACASTRAVPVKIIRNKLTIMFFIVSSEKWTADTVWKKIIQKEMQLRDHADVSSRAFVDRDNRLRTNLKIFSRPDNTRIDRAGRLSLLASV